MIKDIGSACKLNNGIEMPWFGLGVFRAKDGGEVVSAVRWALELGYRMVDTATLYENEDGVGRAVRESGAAREDVFIATKLWPGDFARAEQLLDSSLKKLDMDYVDLYLLHWPGTDADLRHRAWDTILEQMAKGKIRACGVSNFMRDQLEELIAYSGVVPANNQLELHPWTQKNDLLAYCKEVGILVTAWGPIFHGHIGEIPAFVGEIGEQYGKSAAQVVLRWHLQRETIIIPKSVHKERLAENADIFDFALTDDEMKQIDALDGGPYFAFDPYTFDGDVERASKERAERLAAGK